MGTLFWQLNDVWIAPTWSGIDYTGKWKILQYYAKDFFAPTLITGYLDLERQLRVYVLSDFPAHIGVDLAITAVVTIYNWNSFQPVNTTSINTNIVRRCVTLHLYPLLRSCLFISGIWNVERGSSLEH